MLEPEDIHWLQAAVNDLNNVLQVAHESAHSLEGLCREQAEANKYCDFLRTSLERAVSVTGELAARVEGKAPRVKEEPDQRDAGAEDSQVRIANAQSSGELIMLIDDEPMITELVTEMLTHGGYRVVSSLHPLHALELFQKIGSKVDLVILDFTLPIMDGHEVFQELQKLRPDVAVMLSSGFAEQAIVRGMLTRGLRGFLPKPYTEQKLLEQVRSTLDAIRTQRTGERRVL